MTQKIIFLDRDGVICEFPGFGNYVTSLENFRIFPGAKKAIALLTKAGFEIFVLSNQGCVAKKLVTEEELGRMTEWMHKSIESEGGRLAGVFYCPHETSDPCECHKPKTGLFKQAASGRSIDFRQSYFIGDSREDMEAGRAIGCRTVLVLSGRTKRDGWAEWPVKPDHVQQDLLEAVQWILAEKS